MIFTHNLHNVSQPQVFGAQQVPMLEPILQSRPVKQPSTVIGAPMTPSSAAEQKPAAKSRHSPRYLPRYSECELASAALMLQKLKNREDVAPQVLPRPVDADHVLDLVADRLLDRLASAPEDFKFPKMKLVCGS